MLRLSNHLVLAVLLALTLHAVFVKNLVIAVEWNCATSTNAGTYTRATDCTIVGNSRVEIASNNQFELTGENKNMDALVSVTASSDNGHFSLLGGATLTIRYIKLTGGNPTGGHGGSIRLDANVGSTLNVYSSIFINNNVASGKNGGAIYSKFEGSGSKANIINIYDTFFDSNGNDCKNGGAILAHTTVLNVYNATFSGNGPVNQEGGAIKINTGDLNVWNSTCNGNSAVVRAGAIASFNNGDVIWNNVKIGCNVDIQNSIFENNIVTTTDTTKQGGAAFYLAGKTAFSVREVSFVSNEAKNNRGHVISTYTTTLVPTISIINSYFDNPSDSNNFYETNSNYAPTFTTCSGSPCTVSPFTGTCAAVSSTNEKLGVVCNYDSSTSCSNG